MPNENEGVYAVYSKEQFDFLTDQGFVSGSPVYKFYVPDSLKDMIFYTSSLRLMMHEEGRKIVQNLTSNMTEEGPYEDEYAFTGMMSDEDGSNEVTVRMRPHEEKNHLHQTLHYVLLQEIPKERRTDDKLIRIEMVDYIS
ncbi:hypothetical protein [Streptomyces cucumeris]|uniref:hypothetical protein n=1 Tax=Streptomyces cucumeris TaxID=2962890 RepID=UPI003D762019